LHSINNKNNTAKAVFEIDSKIKPDNRLETFLPCFYNLNIIKYEVIKKDAETFTLKLIEGKREEFGEFLKEAGFNPKDVTDKY